MNKVELLQILRDSGMRITKLRSLIIEIILENGKPISAPEILEAVRKHVSSVNKTTIYRCLDTLLEKDIVKKVYLNSDLLHYELSFLPHHHHATCTTCGKVQEVSSHELEKAVANLESSVIDSGFAVKDHIIELRGKCQTCQ